MKTFPGLVCLFPIYRCASFLLVAFTFCSLAFCGEIHDAAKAGDLEKAKALLKSNPALVFSKDDEPGMRYGATPLHLAAAKGHMAIVELLLTNKAEVNAKDGTGMTPLHVAGIGDHRDVAELLLANKAEVNATNNNGQTPLHVALLGDHRGVAELLLANKADVNAKDNKGQTPLFQAIAGGREDVAALLRQHGGHE